MARELAVNETEQESTTDGDNDGLLLGRRSYLQMAGAAAAAAATGAGASGVASAAVSESNYSNVVNIAEAGADTSGNRAINSVLEDHLQDNTLVKFPQGTYKLTPFSASGLQNFAMVAPNGATIDPDHSGGDTLIYLSDAQGVHIEGFDVEQPGSTSSRIVFRATSGTNVLKNWRLLDRQDASDEVGGAFVKCAGSDTVLTLENIDFSKGGVGMGVWARPTIVGDYPDVGEVPELDPAGTLNFVNCDVSRWDHEGLYVSAHSGPINVIGGRYANSNIQQIRTGGPKTVVKGAEVACDDKDLTPRDRNARGIWMKEGNEMLIEDCDIVMSDVGASSGGIVHGAEGGEMTIRNTRIQIDDDVKAVKSRSPKSWPFRAPSMDTAPSSRRLVMENVSVTGTASNDEAILIYGRDGSELRNVCVEQNGSNQNGIQINGSSNVTLRDSNINVTGRATVFSSSDVNTANVSSSDSCPAPQFDDQPVEYGSSDSGGYNNESDLSNYLEVSGGGSYSFATSGEIANGGQANLDKEDSVDVQTASGKVANGGTDSYGFEGELNAIDADDSLTVRVNGEAVNAADYPPVSRPNVVTVSGNDGLASYEFTVDGDLGVGPVNAGTLNEEDNIHGTTAEGAVAGGADAYSFSGSITQFRFTEGTATVLVNGQEVNLEELNPEDGSSGDSSSGDSSSDDSSSDDSRGDTGGSSDSGSSYLEATGDGTYAFTSSGEVTNGGGANLSREDAIDGRTASGKVANSGTDSYDFEGELTTLDADDGVTVRVNGEAVDAADYPSVSRPNVVTVSGNDGLASYEFTVDGELGAGPVGVGSLNEEDNIHGATAEGSVAGGTDAYSFSGSITQFRFTEGTATVLVNGQEVDPEELNADDGSSGDGRGEDDLEGTPEHPHLLVINGPVEGVTNYSIAVTGEIKHTDIVGSVNPEDEVDGNRASGGVAGGTDAYLFSGSITQFNLSGSASVDLQKDYQQK